MESLLILLGYLVGSIPFAFLLARRAGVDLRFAGSGNLGASNVFRTTRKTVGVTVAALDVMKGSAVVLLARRFGVDESICTATGIAAIVGHVYPIWLRLRGGKGVATTCGAFAVLAPTATVTAIPIFGLTLWLSRYVSVASVTGALALGPLAYLTGASQPVVTAGLASAALVVFRHRSNLSRLRAGTERRLGQRAAPVPPGSCA